MITIEWKAQSGKYSNKFVLTPSAAADKANLTALYNEAEGLGKSIVLLSHTHENTDDAMIETATFGIGELVTPIIVTADTATLTFFSADRLYTHLIVKNSTANACQISGGTTSGGFELFTSQTIAANETRAIPLNGGAGLATTAVTALYLHDGGDGDTWNSASLTVTALSDAI